VIIVRELVRLYGELIAVNGLSFAVKPGEILGLVGPNGAGKTTTLRCLAGIIPPTSGQIQIAGRDIQRDPIEAKKRLAFIPDEPHLFDYLTVWDHFVLFTRLYNVLDGETRGQELLREFEIADKALSYPAELSRGMKQKVMISLALLHRPEVVIFDEPLTGLDPMAMRKMKETIAMTARKGSSIIVSSHILHLIEELSSHIVIIKNGKVICEGTLSQIRASIPDLNEQADLEDIFIRATNTSEQG